MKQREATSAGKEGAREAPRKLRTLQIALPFAIFNHKFRKLSNVRPQQLPDEQGLEQHTDETTNMGYVGNPNPSSAPHAVISTA